MRGSAIGLPLFALGALLLAQSCSAEDESVETCDGTTASVSTFLHHQCGSASCHGGTDPVATLDLSGGDITQRLVGASSGTCDGWTLVVPGSPESSFLWHKVYSAKPACGGIMPAGDHLKAVQLACIRDWIESLASVDGGSGCETCGGADCVDLSTDPNHCGSCSVACPAGSACNSATCECAGSLSFCANACVDTQADPRHCGGCDSACPTGALCNAAQCACTGGLEPCADACVDRGSDPQNCGSCGNVCAAGQVCLLGGCASDCGTLTQCGFSCRDTQSNVLSCGSCDRVCPAGASCVAGACVCPAGTSECGTACINTLSDPANCGGCAVACQNGQVCESGQCKCPGGGTACGTQCVDTLTDMKNCGACGNLCAIGQTCENGVCACKNVAVSFSGDVQPILTANCTARGCHSGLRPAENMNLTSGAAYSNLVGVRSQQCTDGRLRVAQGDPAKSYVMNKLMGVSLCFGTQMPKAGTSLPLAQLETIGAWICAGAAQN